MVISGAKARYHGVGKVNGVGSYGFELTAWDGQVSGGGGVDRIRIKIWDSNCGYAVVYDKQLGAADGIDPPRGWAAVASSFTKTRTESWTPATRWASPSPF